MFTCTYSYIIIGDNMYNLIGNTPMIKIKYKYRGIEKYIYVKLEQYNLTGSIKDRIALYIIEIEPKNNNLKYKMPIVEATSGNTGISFAALGAKYNHPVYIFMPDWVSKERIDLIKLYGAQVTLVSKENGGFKKCIQLADSLSKELNGYRPNQFSNKLNVECHYNTTGKEILDKLKDIEIDGFVSGIGSGGTLMGISKRLKERHPNIIIGAVEPDKIPLLTKNKIIDNHKIEGIGDDFIPSLVETNLIDRVYDISDDDAINMARIITKKLGLGIGISGGANLIGAVLLQEEGLKNVVTIFPDDNKKYLSTDLVKEIDYNKDFISNKIDLIDYEVL